MSGDISTSGNLAAILDFWYTSMYTRIMTSAISLLSSVTRKCRVAVGIFSLCALELEICLGVFYPSPVGGKRRKKPLPGEGLLPFKVIQGHRFWYQSKLHEYRHNPYNKGYTDIRGVSLDMGHQIQNESSVVENCHYRAMHFSANARSWDRMSSVRPSVRL